MEYRAGKLMAALATVELDEDATPVGFVVNECEQRMSPTRWTWALAASGCDQVNVDHKPRLLSDNGPCYIAGELAEYIEAQRMSHGGGAPFHPQTQGKIERWHQTMKNHILLGNYFLPGALEAHIEAFVQHYNQQRDHESLSNVTPADAYFGRPAGSRLTFLLVNLAGIGFPIFRYIQTYDGACPER